VHLHKSFGALRHNDWCRLMLAGLRDIADETRQKMAWHNPQLIY
jgi:hypothetical protein